MICVGRFSNGKSVRRGSSVVVTHQTLLHLPGLEHAAERETYDRKKPGVTAAKPRADIQERIDRAEDSGYWSSTGTASTGTGE